MVHVQDALAARRHLPRGPSLFLPEFPLRALVAEDLDLTVAAMHEVMLPVQRVLHVGVNLQVHGQALHPLLEGEVGGKALDGERNEGGLLQGAPVNCDGVEGEVFDARDAALLGEVVGLGVDDALLVGGLALVPEGPRVQLILGIFRVPVKRNKG